MTGSESIQAALEGLIALVRQEYPADCDLSAIASTWGPETITPEQVGAVGQLDRGVTECLKGWLAETPV